MQVAQTYEEKKSASKAAYEFVCDQKAMKPVVRSHQLLEAVLYHISVSLFSGRYKTAYMDLQVSASFIAIVPSILHYLKESLNFCEC